MEWPDENYGAIARQRKATFYADAQTVETNGTRLEGVSGLVDGISAAEDALMEAIDGNSPQEASKLGVDADAVRPTPNKFTLKNSANEGPGIQEDKNEEMPQFARRMATRSTIQHVSPTPTSPPVEVDPFFFPPNYRVDRDYGLPPTEAEETRRLLSAAVQRQEEFLRGLNVVRNDLLRAQNLRKKVWGWCRTMEGMRTYHQHLSEVSGNAGKWDIDEGENVGLSDGEDWYDKEEWGLDGPLEKGREEEDEEMLPQGKKTRGRK